MIRLYLESMGGVEIMDATAKQGVTLAEVCELAENAIFNGYAGYARVEVDGVTYSEFEA